MINRSFKDSMVGGRNIPARMEHRRGLSLNGISKETDENLDLFSRNRRSLSLASSDESDVSVKLGRLSVVPAKLAKSGMDDLLSAADGGKHDYDWLLTPPGTPIFPSSDRIESQAPSAAPRSSSLARSVSTNKASRGIELPSARSRGNFPLPVKSTNLSVSQSESNHPSRPIRSNSVTRPSISTSQYNTYSNKSSSILNTSSTSVSSYIRPSSPAARSSISSSTARPSTPSSRSSMSSSTARPSTPSARSSMSSSTARPSTPSSRSSMSSSTARPSTPSARPVASRSSTPSKARPTPTTTSIERTRPSPNSRPSTPNSRPSIPANLNTPATRPASRPSTPTRRNSAPSLSPSTTHLSPETGLSISIGRMPSNGRNAATLSQPSSPSPRVRPLPQPMILPDFSLETPPNLRTTLPDRPLSAGRSRPGVALTVKGNVENPTPTNVPRRQPSPIGSRGRLSETPVKGRLHPGLQAVETVESRKASHVPELSMRKPMKPSATSTESSGFGRNISKKSLDMAIRHMDIRNGTGGVRPLSGTTRFPQSIRSANPKNQVGRALSAPAAVNGNLPISNNGYISSNGDYINRSPENGIKEENYRVSARLTEVDIYESSRYDTILLKEDLKNTNWLHSFDGKSDQGPIFDNGFEPLPEPFDPL